MNTLSFVSSLPSLNPFRWSAQTIATAASLQIAVASAAAAVFASQPFLAVGFIIMGASVAYLGIKGSQSNAIIEQTKALANSHAATIDSNKNTIRELTSRIEAQTIGANRIREEIEGRLRALLQEKNNLENTHTSLREENQRLKQENLALSEEKDTLENEIVTFTAGYKELKPQAETVATQQQLNSSSKETNGKTQETRLANSVQLMAWILVEKKHELTQIDEKIKEARNTLAQINAEMLKQHMRPE